MSYSQAELTALKAAYARGVKRVTYEGKTVEYDDEASMRRRIQTIEAEIAAANGSPRPRGAYAGFSRGR